MPIPFVNHQCEDIISTWDISKGYLIDILIDSLDYEYKKELAAEYVVGYAAKTTNKKRRLMIVKTDNMEYRKLIIGTVLLHNQLQSNYYELLSDMVHNKYYDFGLTLLDVLNHEHLISLYELCESTEPEAIIRKFDCLMYGKEPLACYDESNLNKLLPKNNNNLAYHYLLDRAEHDVELYDSVFEWISDIQCHGNSHKDVLNIYLEMAIYVIAENVDAHPRVKSIALKIMGYKYIAPKTIDVCCRIAQSGNLATFNKIKDMFLQFPDTLGYKVFSEISDIKCNIKLNMGFDKYKIDYENAERNHRKRDVPGDVDKN